MSGSNAKDGAKAEDFKRATAGALRAIAQQNDVQVAFQPGPHGLAGKRARLPLPTRALPPAEMAKLRGAADSLALRLRHHDDTVHNARMPARREARDVYDALEQARVEVLGSRHMAGVAANLSARLAEECESEGYDRMMRKDQLPVETALALLARERMSGEQAPEAASRVLDLWRGTLGDKAEAALDEMARDQADQAQFARAARRLLAAMNLAEAEADADHEQGEDGEEGAEQSGDQDSPPDSEGQSESEAESMLGAQPEEMEGEVHRGEQAAGGAGELRLVGLVARHLVECGLGLVAERAPPGVDTRLRAAGACSADMRSRASSTTRFPPATGPCASCGHDLRSSHSSARRALRLAATPAMWREPSTSTRACSSASYTSRASRRAACGVVNRVVVVPQAQGETVGGAAQLRHLRRRQGARGRGGARACPRAPCGPLERRPGRPVLLRDGAQRGAHRALKSPRPLRRPWRCSLIPRQLQLTRPCAASRRRVPPR